MGVDDRRAVGIAVRQVAGSENESRPIVTGEVDVVRGDLLLDDRDGVRAIVGADTENARYSAASKPISDCQKYFSRERMPFGSL